MSTFDYVQIGNGPVTLTCRNCNHRTTVAPRFMQRTVDQHRCGKNTRNAANAAR